VVQQRDRGVDRHIFRKIGHASCPDVTSGSVKDGDSCRRIISNTWETLHPIK